MAATDLERLIVQVEANSSKLSKDMAKLQRDVDRGLGNVEKRTAKMSANVTASFGKAGAALTAFFSVRAVTQFVGHLVDAADKLEALSERTGVGTDQLQKLAAAGRAANVDVEDLNESLDTFAKNIGRAAEGQGDLAKVFAEQNIKPTGDLVDTLLQVAEAVQKAKTRSEEYRITTAALGKANADLINLLRQGPAAIKAQMDAFKGGITPEANRELAEFKQHWQEIEISFANMAAGPAAAVLKGLSDFLRDIEQGSALERLQAVISLLSFGLVKPPDTSAFSQALDDLNATSAEIDEVQGRLKLAKQRAEQTPILSRARVDRDAAVSEIQRELDTLIAKYQTTYDKLVQIKNTPPPTPAAAKPFGGAPDAGSPTAPTEALDFADAIQKLEDGFQKIRDAETQFRSDQFEEAQAVRDRAAEFVIEQHESELEAIRQFHEDAKAAWDGYYERLAEKRQADADDAAEKSKRELDERLQAASDFFGNLASLSQSGNAALKEIGKAAAIAQATISGVQAVMKAYAEVPPPFNIAAAAAAGVFAAVQIAKLTAMREGGVMSSRGPMQLSRYARGGIAHSPQMAMFGEGATPEAFVPLPDGRRIPVALESPRVPAGMGGPSSSNVFNIDARGAQQGVADQIEAKLRQFAPAVVGTAVSIMRKSLPDDMRKANSRKL